MTDFRAKGTIMGPAGLTAVFGMGTGVTPPVWSPEIHTIDRQIDRAGASGGLVTSRAKTKQRSSVSGPLRVSPRRPALNDPVESGGWSRHWDAGNVSSPATACTVFTGDGSGWSSDRLLELVRCGGRPPCTPSPSTWSSSRSLQGLRPWKPRLGGGFALRCLQRLSGPDLATRRCPERDSRHTRGRSSPILSY